MINKILYQRAKENHIQWRECNTESYQRSKPSSLSNKRQPLLLWTFESLTHSFLSSQELSYCIYHYTTTIKINVKRENRQVTQSIAAGKKSINDLKFSQNFITRRSTIWLFVNSLYSFFYILFVLYSFLIFLFEVYIFLPWFFYFS